MILCRSCIRLSGEHAIFCNFCGRSFGCRMCRSRPPHRNPPEARFCSKCGSDELSDAAAHVRLGWLTRFLILVFIVAVIRLAGGHVACVIGAIFKVFDWAVGTLFGISPTAVCLWALGVVQLVGALLIASFVLPARTGSKFRSGVFSIMRSLAKLVVRSIYALHARGQVPRRERRS